MHGLNEGHIAPYRADTILSIDGWMDRRTRWNQYTSRGYNESFVITSACSTRSWAALSAYSFSSNTHPSRLGDGSRFILRLDTLWNIRRAHVSTSLTCLTHCPSEMWQKLWKYNSHTHYTELYLEHSLWSCCQGNATEPNQREVNIGLGNGLVQSGNKPLPEPTLTKTSVDIWRH